jgi:hypothetical protein
MYPPTHPPAHGDPPTHPPTHLSLRQRPSSTRRRQHALQRAAEAATGRARVHCRRRSRPRRPRRGARRRDGPARGGGPRPLGIVPRGVNAAVELVRGGRGGNRVLGLGAPRPVAAPPIARTGRRPARDGDKGSGVRPPLLTPLSCSTPPLSLPPFSSLE